MPNQFYTIGINNSWTDAQYAARARDLLDYTDARWVVVSLGLNGSAPVLDGYDHPEVAEQAFRDLSYDPTSRGVTYVALFDRQHPHQPAGSVLVGAADTRMPVDPYGPLTWTFDQYHDAAAKLANSAHDPTLGFVVAQLGADGVTMKATEYPTRGAASDAYDAVVTNPAASATAYVAVFDKQDAHGQPYDEAFFVAQQVTDRNTIRTVVGPARNRTPGWAIALGVLGAIGLGYTAYRK